MMKGSDIRIQEKKAKLFNEWERNLNGYKTVQNVWNQVVQNPRVQNVGNQNGLIGKLGAKENNGEMNVSFDELSAMAFEQRSSKPGLQGMTSGQISSGLDLIYAPSTITSQQPTEGELDLLFEATYDDYIGGQLSATVRIILTAPEPQDVNKLNPNALFDGNTLVNPSASPFTSAAESSSSHNVDPSNMYTFYQPYPYEFQ
nr:hypothetical protein [Tanacetum cinerariifolium]